MRLLALALPFALGACNADAPGSPAAPPLETATYAAALGVNISASTKLSSGMYYRDITVGTGATVASGMTVGARYIGYLTNGNVFDSNTSAASPFSFKIGSGQVIQGWEQGLIGAKVGTTRQLIIPPGLGYGASGSGAIPGNAILVFTVTIASAQ
jgi:peptidylprolyl isomerase